MVATLDKPKTTYSIAPGASIASSQYPELMRLINGTYLDRVEQISAAEVDANDNIIAVALDGAKKLAVRITDDDISIKLMGGEQAANSLKFAAPKKKPKKCSKGISCGASCIAASKTCRKKTSPTQKAQKQKIVKEAKAAEKVAKEEVPAKLPAKAKEVVKEESIATMADGSKKPITQVKQKSIEDIEKLLGADKLRMKNVITVNTNERNEIFSSIRKGVPVNEWVNPVEAYRNADYQKEASLLATLDINAVTRLPIIKEPDLAINAIKQLPNDHIVVLHYNDKSFAEKLGLKPLINDFDIDIDLNTGIPTNLEIQVFAGKVKNGKVENLSEEELKAIRRIRDLREEATEDVRLIHETAAGDSRNDPDYRQPLGKSDLKEILETEDDNHFVIDEAEDDYFGRKPTGKHGDYNSYKKKSEVWARAKFGEFNEGANGYTLAQTKAHDMAHPITHDLIGLDSDGIHKKLGNLKDAAGNDALYAEEAIVNVMEQLSRGSSIEASILNGVRLVRNMTRPNPVTGVQSASKEANSYVRSPKFVQDLSALAHKAYRHNDFAPLIGHVRKSNRISGTVRAAGDNFNNSATGG